MCRVPQGVTGRDGCGGAGWVWRGGGGWGKWGGVGRSAARSVGIKKLACVCHGVLESVRFTCVIGSAIVNSLNNVEGCWLT